MRIAIGSDHAGVVLKTAVASHLTRIGHVVDDLGPYDPSASVDYPDFGAAVGRAVTSGEAEIGVAICGSGIGMAIAANKIAGVRAAVIHDVTEGRLARQHNHANVVCFGARTTGEAVVIDSLDAFLEAEPEARHAARLDKLTALDAERA
ncbi:MAG: RpiB/LacA/LacB family sugar-phosphate isomerase [Actinobacteria bacterium]|nr:RpiB/LacA/LacB family sugar-phosphate isomerase [Actinomycetota bacterium]